jgi:hypothetical protein
VTGLYDSVDSDGQPGTNSLDSTASLPGSHLCINPKFAPKFHPSLFSDLACA